MGVLRRDQWLSDLTGQGFVYAIVIILVVLVFVIGAAFNWLVISGTVTGVSSTVAEMLGPPKSG